MSYLAIPRMHFSGYFQADVSTVNNDVRHFDSAKFQPHYQLPETKERKNGWWNPEGTGAFRLVECKVTGGNLDGRLLSKPEDDPAIGMTLAGADGRVCGKLVDLDPQQQSVSEIWGLQVRLTRGAEKALFMSDYQVAPFMDLWRRQQGSSQGDQTLASYYQSVLENVVWNETAGSKLLEAIREASCDGLLSIKFNVFGFKLDSNSPEFTLGNITGTIGPAGAEEPTRFVTGRHMMATLPGPTSAAQNVFNFPCRVDRDGERVSADFGNALPISDGEGSLKNLGVLVLGVLKDAQADNGDVITKTGLEALGEVPYLDAGWYQSTAGVADFSYAGNEWIRSHIQEQPLVLARPLGADQYEVLIRESLDGLYVRADQFVQRLDPGASASVDFHVSRFGQPHAGTVDLQANNSMIGGGGGSTPLKPPVPIPNVGEPADVVSYPSSIRADERGRARLTITSAAVGPGNPRGYLDGQLYGVGFKLADQPEGYHSNPWLFISVLVWGHYGQPAEPTWYRDIQPILQQYGNLYPIMSKHLVDLGDYGSVAAHRGLLQLAFSLPVSDPNYMPVTRDLSSAKRDTLLKWLATSGPDGLPVKGHSVQRTQTEAASMEAFALESAAEATGPGGKTAFMQSLNQKKSK